MQFALALIPHALPWPVVCAKPNLNPGPRYMSRPHDESADSAHREIEIFLLARLVRLIEPDRMSY